MNRGNVIVTGASSGIGAATALLLERSGFRVFAGIRKSEDGERLRAQSSGNLLPLRLDVTETASIRAAVDEVKTRLGGEPLTGLVNNAGVYVLLPVEVFSPEAFRQVFEVNVLGTLAVTQAFLPLLRQARGRLAIIGSCTGRAATPGAGAYAGSKFALEALTSALRSELEQFGLQVTLVAPGTVRTPIWKKGRETAIQVTREAPAEVQSLYAPLLERMLRMNAELAESGIAPEEVARVVLKALTDKRASTRYSVGKESHILDVLRFVPDRLRELLLRKPFGL